MKEQTKVMRLDKKEQRLIELFRQEGMEPLTSLLEMVLNNEGTYDKERMKNEEYVKVLRTGKWMRSLLKNEKFLLEDFESCGYLSSEKRKKIEQAIQENKNIIITGSVGVGKTVLLNALMKYQLDRFPERKSVIVERCPEISLDIDCDETILIRDDGDFSMKSLRFLQDSNEPSKLTIGELLTDEDFLSLVAGLQGGSSVSTTLQCGEGEELKKRILSRLKWMNNTEKQIEALHGTSFLEVHMSMDSEGQRIIDIKEVCI
ncbi:ATPase, T2SS/T4P/T4SS family [Bacillus thuringiensis]|uniref:ATPase, T2SS/T4P/T4SS family n=1 Tax=Bacillus thuringiensis TaxID=1428 RepID=UPI0011A8A20C|nr:ATPase, T2SS/T4P/T4SS family [Bacillus thuringiensis]